MLARTISRGLSRQSRRSASTALASLNHYHRSPACVSQNVKACFLSTSSSRPSELQQTAASFIPEDKLPEGLERVEDETDVLIVGAGPAGLAAAIRVKKLAEEAGKEIRVVVLEKASEVGAHTVSGAVIETKALDELLPDWKDLGAPLNTPCTADRMKWLTEKSAYPLPHPPQMSNKGNYIVSLSQVVRWLGEQAEALGVEIYPGFAGAQPIFNADGTALAGVATNDIGLDKNGEPKDAFEPGMVFKAKCTLVAEGARGSLGEALIKKFNLREGKDAQTYGIGVKEVWRIKPENSNPGEVIHTLGYPLDNTTYGGSFMYHMNDNLVTLGLVIGLDYKNPYISPFREFQRIKHHPLFANILEGGECIAYAGRTLNEGGSQSVPKLTMPGGALIGCTAGFVNVPKIKGTHTAMKTGMLAADAAFKAISEAQDPESFEPLDVSAYETLYEQSWVKKELDEVRNLRPSFHSALGNLGGIMYSGIDSLILKGRTPWTFHHPGEDYAQTEHADKCKPIEYPAPDGKLSFDLLTSVSRTGTNHTENQPVHLVLKNQDSKTHTDINVGQYAGLLGRACPAGVYEYLDAEDGNEDARGKKFNINSQNCIHCKLCSIKTPTQDITWTVPEGGGGPKYSIT